jgi:hypothetical protein
MWQANGLIAHTLERPSGLIECETVLDVGAGVRPMNWYVPKRHICVEPHPAYADRLQTAGYEVWRMDARSAVAGSPVIDAGVEAVYLLDVIEHLTREKGEALLAKIRALPLKQIVVFTPVGFMQQEGDAWGLGGEYWQKHRSGWVPSDFPGWDTYARKQGFFAVWTAP